MIRVTLNLQQNHLNNNNVASGPLELSNYDVGDDSVFLPDSPAKSVSSTSTSSRPMRPPPSGPPGRPPKPPHLVWNRCWQSWSLSIEALFILSLLPHRRIVPRSLHPTVPCPLPAPRTTLTPTTCRESRSRVASNIRRYPSRQRPAR